LIRREAIEIICNKFKKNIVISANGFISRDLFSTLEKNTNFYMIGSMGLASSIALGIAIKKPSKKIFVFDGDGNVLMNLGSLVTIGSLQPKNLIHIIFDNKMHESTGGQPTHSKTIDLSKIAKAVNYKIFKINSKTSLTKTLGIINQSIGPMLLLVQISKSKEKSSRVEIDPVEIKKRFTKAIN
tara:strand:+ start:206 stop:757 length:552 start_codon:yes stop_codon:yes gene_type:complete